MKVGNRRRLHRYHFLLLFFFYGKMKVKEKETVSEIYLYHFLLLSLFMGRRKYGRRDSYIGYHRLRRCQLKRMDRLWGHAEQEKGRYGIR